MNPRNQTLSWADILKGTEQELLNADYEKNMQLSNLAGNRVTLPGEQNVPLPLSTDEKSSDRELSVRNPGSSISSYCEDADQLEPTLIPTHPNDLDEQSLSDYPNRKDENARSSISMGFVQMIQKLLRPGVRPGYRRLQWKCISYFLRLPAIYTH